MSAPVQEPADTAGMLFCHHRRYGCGWVIVYRTFADEPLARQDREVHEISCAWRPYPDLYA